MERKVLLVSLWGNCNQGNRLQMLAMKVLLEQLTCDVTALAYEEPNMVVNWIKKTIKIGCARLGCKKYSYAILDNQREKRFRRFNALFFDKKIVVKDFEVSNKQKKLFNKNYDCAIVGSDQVWHGWFDTDQELQYFYLKFMPNEKRIAYAASFGLKEISKRLGIHRLGIEGMKHISVREKSAKKIIEEISSKTATVVLDPTLCLDKKTWQNLEKKPDYSADNYIFVYFLGDITKEYQKAIELVKKKYNAEVVNVFSREYPKYYLTRPDEFIYLIRNAAYVCTDSFHAVAFSIIFEKPFSVFHRQQVGFEDMFDRIRTLLQTVGLEKCEYVSLNSMVKSRDEIDWKSVSEKLEIEKKSSIEFLRNAICG